LVFIRYPFLHFPSLLRSYFRSFARLLVPPETTIFNQQAVYLRFESDDSVGRRSG